METATVLIIFIASLLLGVTGYSMYTAFGPGSKDLRDPFEDHGAIRSQLRCNFHINWGRSLIFYNYGWI
jgi:PsbN protein